MDVVTLGAALSGSKEQTKSYVKSHFKGGSNIQIVDNADGTQTINASGEVSAEDTVARETIAEHVSDKTNPHEVTKTQIGLGNVDNTSDINKPISTATQNALNDKVDKELGKGLSTNDFTTVEKTKLEGIAEGAEVNVQSNWTQTTTTADDYIKNKPTLGTAAAKNATDTYSATGTDVTTGKAVAAALATLPEPMVFKGSLGTGGTITTLPTASSSNKGCVYKVITTGTYASQFAKVGDTFISDGSAWVLIPSGDEPSGTVTNVAVVNGGGLAVSGSPITSSGTIIVGHSNSVTAKTSSSVKKFTYDEYGHITGSSELSTAESDALASGIDSAKVAQIETNKSNILFNTNTGVKNIIKTTATSRGIFTVNADGTIKAQGTNSGSSAAFLIVSTISASDAYRLNGMILNGCPSGGESGGYRINLQLCGGGYTNYAIDRGDSAVISGIPQNPSYNLRLIVAVEAGKTVDIVFKPMISIIGGEYQPYAMSNAELTAKEQVNENNISTNEATLVELVDGGAKNFLQNTAVSQAMSGVTFTVNSDKSVTLSGTATSNITSFFINREVPVLTEKMVLSGCPEGGSTNTYKLDILDGTPNGSVLFEDFGEGTDVDWNLFTTGIYTTRIRIGVGTTVDGLIFKPMLCTKAAWRISPSYQPHRPSYQELAERTAIYTVESSLFSYVDTLSEGIYFAKQTAATGTDKPVSGKRYMYQIFVYSSYFATVVAYEGQGASAPIIYTANKENGTWGSWYKFEGTAVT